MSGDGQDYLLFPEDLEGQSVVDLSSGEIAGHSPVGGGVIWTEFHPSPDRSFLAVVGCYWAGPWQVTVYDFRNPLDLPLREVAQFDLPEANAAFGEWTSSCGFTVVGPDGTTLLCEVTALK